MFSYYRIVILSFYCTRRYISNECRYNNTQLNVQEGEKPHQFFCCKACFISGWKAHTEAYHPTNISQKLSTDLEDDISPLDLIINKDEDKDSDERKRIRAMTNDENRWSMIVSDGDIYIPGPEDVGRYFAVSLSSSLS